MTARATWTSRSTKALRRSTGPVANTARDRSSRSEMLAATDAFYDEIGGEIHGQRDQHQHAADREQHTVVETAFDRFPELRRDGRGQRPRRIQHGVRDGDRV